jgi:sigma-E factor negative regulatory protein RseC
MLTETGTVFHAAQGIVQIKLDRKQACADCHACFRSQDGEFMVAEAKDPIGVSLGDVVRIESSSNVGQVKASLILYILPVLFLIVGYMLSQPLARSLGIRTTGEAPGIISGFLLMGFAFLGVYLVSHIGKRVEKNRFKVVEVLGHAASLQSDVL